MQSKYEAMIFDMDGTLLDSMWFWRTIWREYIAERGLPTPSSLAGRMLSGCGRACEALAAEPGVGMTRDELFQGMLSILDRHYRTDVWPKPFAGDLLRMLRAKGYKVAVATATPRRLAEPALARHGLMELVDFLTDTEEMGVSKSHPGFFLNVAARLGVKPESCVMFEDSVYAIRAAKQAGMAVCAIDDTIAWPDREEIRALADRYVTHWGELTGGEPPRYRNIVLDFGNVIGKFSLDMLTGMFCADEADRALLKAAVLEGWGELDAGAVDYADFISSSLSRLPERVHPAARRFFDGWMTSLPYVEGMPELIAELKEKHYHMYLLSNAPVCFAERIGHYRVLEGFDGLVVSGPLRMVKPDRAIFEYLLSAYALDPARTLFVDDSARNVEGARACGLDAYHFHFDTDALRRYILR